MSETITLTATMMSARRDAEGSYDFEAPADVFESRTPVQIVKLFAEYVDSEIFPKDVIDFEINGAFKNLEHRVVTAMGQMIVHIGRHDGAIPFMVMISEKRG
ncbi:MAG: hypothetical protein RLO01_19640 [Thalassobaculaceae bacterium]